jgi:RimJ/RimL family protein N-acetyltransferase
MVTPSYPIATERLLLRPWRLDELDCFHALRSNSDVVRYLYEDPLTREQAAEKLAERRSDFTPGEWVNIAVERAADGVVLGDAALRWTSEEHRQAEIGYTFDPAHHGNGYATEAAAKIVELAFELLGVHRVIGRIDARNSASARLLERLGMRREGLLIENELVKGEWTDEAIFAILEREWRARRGRIEP